MKKLIAQIVLCFCVSSLALAGEIPGSNPAPPCTENCPAAQSQPEPTEVPIIEVVDIVTGLLSLIF